MSATRIYIVRETAGEKPLLVKAATPAQALRHVVYGLFTVDVASQDDLVTALGAGAIVEIATPIAGEK